MLTAAEVLKLNLFGTRLIVLSACETGLGQPAVTLGMNGMKRALFQAGAENVLLTLWELQDETSAAFFTNFYERFAGGMNLHEAFETSLKACLTMPGDSMGLYLRVRCFGCFTLTRGVGYGLKNNLDRAAGQSSGQHKP